MYVITGHVGGLYALDRGVYGPVHLAGEPGVRRRGAFVAILVRTLNPRSHIMYCITTFDPGGTS